MKTYLTVFIVTFIFVYSCKQDKAILESSPGPDPSNDYRLLFLAEGDLWSMNLDGSNLILLADLPHSITNYKISKDQSTILLFECKSGQYGEFSVTDLFGNNIQKIEQYNKALSFDISFNGKQIVYNDSSYNLRLIDIYSNEDYVIPATGWVIEPIFVSNTQILYGAFDIFLINTDGTGERMNRSGLYLASGKQVFPDGERLLLYEDHYKPGILNLNTGELKNLPVGFSQKLSPDGQFVFYFSNGAYCSDYGGVYRYKVNGENVEILDCVSEIHSYTDEITVSDDNIIIIYTQKIYTRQDGVTRQIGNSLVLLDLSKEIKLTVASNVNFPGSPRPEIVRNIK